MRKKRQGEKRNVQEGDVVLLKDGQVKCNDWPIGLIVRTLQSSDNRVRKAEVKIMKQGVAKTYLRPVTEVTVLLSDSEQKN